MPRLSAETIARLREANPLDAIIATRTPLGRANGKGVRAGMCLCEPVRGKAPLWVNCATNTFGCLKPNGCGGDVFDYLETFEGIAFADAVARLGGAEAGPVDPAVAAKLEAERAAAKAERRRREVELDERQRAKAFEIWEGGFPARGTLVDLYLRRRGLTPWPSRALRFSHDEPFYVAPQIEGGRPRIIHRGPCMLAAIQAPDGRFSGVHRTWLDPRLDPRHPAHADFTGKGKATITLPDGTPADVKKMRGIKKRGAIRLSDLRDRREEIDAGSELVLVVGEGIETTASALKALERHGRPGTLYFGWAAGDLGNMAGGTLGPSTPHPERSGRWVPSSEPDPADPGVLPPAWATRAILLGDGDSDRLVTTARLACAKARFDAAGCPSTIRMAPAGVDFNDLARGAVERV